MLEPDAANGDFRFVIVFALDGSAGEAPEHGNLADVGERVSDRALEKAFRGNMQHLAGGKIVVELFDGGEETLHFCRPRQGRGVVPGLVARSDGQSPVEEVAHMGKDLRRRSGFVADVIAGEMGRSVAQSLSGAIGDGSNGMAEKLAGVVRRCRHR